MRFLELEITNVRGIRHMLLRPQGRNLLVIGPNGVGKSSIVDAIDFLLTGDISRLTGRGTGSISLASAGPTLGCSPEQAVVKATISIEGIKDEITFGRCMANAKKVVCEEKYKYALDPLLAVASKGQTILTRKNILKFVAENPSDRAGKINDLLNLQDIESLRKTLVESANKCGKEFDVAKAIEGNAVRDFLSAVGQSALDSAAILDYANSQRKVLGASSLASLRATSPKNGVVPPSATPSPTVDWNEIRSTTTSLVKQLQSAPVTLREYVNDFNSVIQELHSSDQVAVDAKQVQLTTIGLELLGDDDACPLCETDFPHGELRTILAQRIKNAGMQSERLGRLGRMSGQLRDSVAPLRASCERLLKLCGPILTDTCTANLKQYGGQLTALESRVAEAHERLTCIALLDTEGEAIADTSELLKCMEGLLASANEKEHVFSPAQIAWDRLTRLELSLASLDNSVADRKRATATNLRAQSLLRSFVTSKDALLNELYESVQNRFIEFYRFLHTSNEPGFTATLRSDNAGLDLAVDFLGQKMAPPLAYHSEGHQDSMGICLYLALAEHLGMGKIHVTVLDDVVMSVDTEHRHALCALLQEKFPDHQFVITTHDYVWAMQLQESGTVQHRDCKELSQWNLDTGPYDGPLPDLWERIDQALAKDDVKEAAPLLRRGAEEFLQTVCDALHANVVFKKSHRYELGDLLPAALGRYRRLLNEAKSSAISWGKSEDASTINELESIRRQVSQQVQAEQGNVNRVVHYNEWANLSPDDFGPVVAAFHSLYDLFFCSACGSAIYVIPETGDSQSLRCKCTEMNLNLVRKTAP